MKNSIDGLAEGFDFTDIAGYSIFFFVGVGFVLTAIVQSSSAAMAIILSVVFSGVISFDKAAAMVIGTNMGTTITVILGSLAGPAIKKQIGLSHFIFNFATGLITILLLPYLILFIKLFYPVDSDPVIGLALFHTLFNTLGVCIFLPLLVPFSKLIVYLISDKPDQSMPSLVKVTTEVPEAAIASFENAYGELLYLVMKHNLELAKIDPTLVLKDKNLELLHLPEGKNTGKYTQIKSLQGQLIAFAAEIQSRELSESESGKLNRLMHSTRFAVNSAKTMKDIREYIEEMADSENPVIQEQYHKYRRFTMSLYQELSHMSEQWEDENLSTLLHWREKIIQMDGTSMKELAKATSTTQISPEEIDLLLSANRGFILSSRQLVSSIRDSKLTEQEIQIYDNV